MSHFVKLPNSGKLVNIQLIRTIEPITWWEKVSNHKYFVIITNNRSESSNFNINEEDYKFLILRILPIEY